MEPPIPYNNGAPMRRVSKLWFLVLVSAVLGLPSMAQAQFQFRTFGGGFSGGGFSGGGGSSGGGGASGGW